MNSKENNTGSAGGATLTCVVSVSTIETINDVVERTDGLIGKALAGKNLSGILLRSIEQQFGPSTKQPSYDESRQITINPSQWDELYWLAAEVWDICGRLDEMLGELDRRLVEVSNAAYDARKAVAK